MADPTGARQRTINSFFDSPRVPIKALPLIEEEVVVTPPPPPPPAAPATADASSKPAASTAAPAAPRLTLAIPVYSQRSIHRFVEQGLVFEVRSDREVADVDVRLFEVLASGQQRPMGSAFRVAPGPAGAKLRVEPTRFARDKLGAGGRRTLRAVARATGRDGAVGTASATFHVY
jgi:hypothetical protein